MSSHLTINETFFKQLWPLILDDNICDTHSKNKSPFFVPKKPFDALWAHGFLASKGYGEYESPISFHCPPCVVQNTKTTSDSDLNRMEIQLDEEGQEDCEFKKDSRILRLDAQFAELKSQEQHRQKLANDFKNRTIPWYIPCCRAENSVVNDLQTDFVNPFERQLLHTIHVFDCKFMIINLGSYFRIADIEIWLKFCKYLKIVLVVRKEKVAAKLTRLNPALYTLLFQDNCENTWQQELTRALNTAVEYAQETKIMTNCAVAFVYVFSSRSDIDCLDKFRILRKT